MAKPVTGLPWATMPIEEDVYDSLSEILEVARELRPGGGLSYSDVIRLLLEFAQSKGHEVRDISKALADKKA